MNDKTWEQGPKITQDGVSNKKEERGIDFTVTTNENHKTPIKSCNQVELNHGHLEAATNQFAVYHADLDSDSEKKENEPSDGSCPAHDSSSLSPETEEMQTYPEGGLSAWLVVAGSFCGMFASLGIANSLASFQAYISENQLSSHSPGQIGWIFSIYTFLSFACGIYIGPLFDVYGPRWLLLPGSVCMVSSMMLIGICTEYWHFVIVFGVIGGVGTALLFTPCVAAVGHYFNKRRGTTTGIAVSGGAFGGVIFPLMLQSLIPQIGFAWSTRVLGFIFVLLCLVANLLVKANLSPSQLATSPHPDFEILAQPAFALTVLGCFLIEWALFVPLTYITSYAIYEGYSQAFSYQILPILSAGSIFGRWFPGVLADKIGRYNTAILSILLTLFSVFAIWLPFGSHTPGIVTFAVVFGFASGSNISLMPVCVGQLCETRDYGRYYATCYTIVSFGCLTGVPIAGVIIERCGGAYWGLVLFTGVSYAGALAAFVVARVVAGGWGAWTKY